MKIYFISIFMIICIKTNAQIIELKGRYGASFLGAESINFVGTDSFYFNGFYCTNGVEGRGRCELAGGFLYLNFEKKKLNKLDSARLDDITKVKSSNDSFSVINVLCIDTFGNPIKKLSLDFGTIGTTTNENGSAKIKLKNQKNTNKLIIYGMGYEPKEINLITGFDYKIKVCLKDGMHAKLNNGELFVYEINEISDDVIVMRNIEGGVSAGFVTYRKRNK